MAGAKYRTRVNGVDTLVASNNSSAGSSDANKLVSLNGAGQIDSTMLPSSVGQTTRTGAASSAISAGQFVNYSGTGWRPADSTSGYPADGYSPAAVASGATGTFNLAGVNSNLSGLTSGTDYYLGANGAVVTGANVPSASGSCIQRLGRALSTTELEFEPGEATFQ